MGLAAAVLGIAAVDGGIGLFECRAAAAFRCARKLHLVARGAATSAIPPVYVAAHRPARKPHRVADGIALFAIPPIHRCRHGVFRNDDFVAFVQPAAPGSAIAAISTSHGSRVSARD